MNDTMNLQSHELPVLSLMTESGSEDVYYPLMYEGFPEEFKLLAEEELKESEEKKLNGIQILRDHIMRKNLHAIPDYLLVATLRACKYDIKKSKNKIEKLISLRKEIADLLVKMGLRKMELIMDNFSCGMLPYRHKNGSFILYTCPDGFDLNRHSVDDVVVVCLLLVLLMLQFPITTVSGGTYFADCKHPSITYIYPTLKTAGRFILTPLSLPMRILKMNILNPVPATYFVYRMIRAVFPQKVSKRISILPKGYDALLKEYNKKLLPEVFSGDAGPLSNSLYKENALEFARELIAEYE